MKPPTPLRVALLVTLCATTVPAQQYVGIDSQEPWDSSFLGPGNFVDLQVATIDDDPLPDAVVLDGTQLVLVHSPAQHHAYSLFGNVTSAMAIWPGLGTSDRVLASESDRLAVYRYDAQTGEFAGGTQLGGGVTAAAREIRYVLDPTDDVAWLSGISTDGLTLFAGKLHGLATYEPVLEVTLERPARTFDALQWDGTEGLEFLIHDEVGLHLRDANGNVDPSLAAGSSAPRPQLLHFLDPSLAIDRAVWSTLDPFGVPVGTLVDSRYPPLIEPPLLFTTLAAEELGFLDYDEDGRLDLWFATANTHQAWILYGADGPDFPTQSTFTPSPERTSIFDLSGDLGIGVPPTHAPIGGTADFDLDGDLDFLFVSIDHGHINFLRGDRLDEELFVPALVDYSFNRVESEDRVFFDFQLDVTVPLENYPAEAVADLQVDVYMQPSVSAQAEESIVGNATTPLFAQPAQSEVEVSLRIDVTDDPEKAVYQFELRLRDTQGIQVGPARAEYFAYDPETNTALTAEGNPWSTSSIPFDNTGFHRRSGSGPFCRTCSR